MTPLPGQLSNAAAADDVITTEQALPGARRGFIRKDWVASLGAAGLSSINDFLVVKGEPLSKPGLGDRYRARLVIAHGPAKEALYLKRFGPDSLATRLRGWWETGHWISRAGREAITAQALAHAGVPVPEIIAWGEGEGQAGSSFVLLRGVPGSAAHVWTGRLPRETRAQKRALADALGELAGRFHSLGWRHRDFYLCHVFVDETPAGLRLTLIDLQRAFRPRWRRRRWLVKDLAQLHYSAQGLFSRGLQARFAASYARIHGSLAELHGAVLKKSRAIARRTER